MNNPLPVARTKKLAKVTQKNNNYKENLKCPLEKIPSKKEFMKTIKFITESKNNAEKNKKTKKDDFKSKTKETIKNQVLQATKTKMYGIKSSLSKNLPKNLSQKNLQIHINHHQTKSLKIKA